jgi:hypothetical protein
MELPRKVDVEYSEIVLGLAGPLSSCSTAISIVSVLRKTTSSLLGDGTTPFPLTVAIIQGNAVYVQKHRPKNNGKVMVERTTKSLFSLR